MTEICDFSDLPTHTCAHCVGETAVRDPGAPHERVPFTAQYEGPCAGGDRISPGDLIVHHPDGYCHVECS